MSTSKVDDTPTPEEILKEGSRRMDMAIEFLKRDMQSVRTGRATPSLVEKPNGRLLRHTHALGSDVHYIGA